MHESHVSRRRASNSNGAKMGLRYACGPAAVILALLTLLFVVPLFIGEGSDLNSLTEYIDITCGRRRYERYLLWIKVSERVEETELSRTYRELVGEPPESLWRTAFSFSPSWSKYSPQYSHGRSAVGAHELTEALQKVRFADDAKKTVIVSYFDLVQKDDDGHRARDYAIAVLGLACEVAERGNAVIETAQLPPLPEEKK